MHTTVCLILFYTIPKPIPKCYSETMPRNTKPINLFRYLDYRKYLRDLYGTAKKSRAGFSFRHFSKKAGFGSSNFYKLVMDGDRNLTEGSLEKFARGLKLNKQEQEFFRNLVFFNQAKTHQGKDTYYKKLLQSRKFNELKPMTKDQYKFYATWYHAVVRELVTSKDCGKSFEAIAKKIQPPLTSQQVQGSVELLESLGFIEKTKTGFRQSSPIVTTGPEVGSLILMNYHKELLALASERLPKIPSEKRDISALTLGIAKEKLPEIKKRIQEFRKSILEFVSTETNPETVALLNIQFFPVTEDGEQNET